MASCGVVNIVALRLRQSVIFDLPGSFWAYRYHVFLLGVSRRPELVGDGFTGVVNLSCWGTLEAALGGQPPLSCSLGRALLNRLGPVLAIALGGDRYSSGGRGPGLA